MPWTKTNYPASMKNLPEAVRDKAIGIDNVLLEEKNIGLPRGIIQVPYC